MVRRLESSVGSDLADVLDKEAVKAQLDQALLPFRVAVAAWSGRGYAWAEASATIMAYAGLLKRLRALADITRT